MKKQKRDEWDEISYGDISKEENEEIRVARRSGYAVFFPCADGAATLKGARKFMEVA